MNILFQIYDCPPKKNSRQAQERFERLIEDMKQTQGITEQLKAENALEWVGRLGNIRACAKGDCKQGNHFCISEQKRQGEISAVFFNVKNFVDFANK